MSAAHKRMYLIAEFCAADFYHGWHLYLRDSNNRQQPNADGNWGWIRWRSWQEGRHGVSHPAQAVFDVLGIAMKPNGDGTCDDDAYAEIARRFPVPRQRIGGKPRGCIEVDVDEFGGITITNTQPPH